jgi:deoxyribonuclease V
MVDKYTAFIGERLRFLIRTRGPRGAHRQGSGVMRFMTARFAVTDVHYPPAGGARAALVLARDAQFAAIAAERVVELDEVADYEPGRFYLRELPALRAVLDGVPAVSLLIVDGYADLEPEGRRPGLGFHCHKAFGVPVIGVAKTRFEPASHAIEVRRGNAHRPLYVTAAGIEVAEAADLVAGMSGPFRLPDALKRVDSLARGRSVPIRSPLG